jgi:uncharacterized protein
MNAARRGTAHASSGIITPALMRKLRQDFALDWRGIHGVGHWGRVRTNGLKLAAATGANRRVVELFAVLHDSRRLNDGYDPGHGARGAANAAHLQGRFYDLDGEELDLLHQACSAHSDGLTDADVTVQVCWDADRLDLGRVGIEPSPARLCTQAARDPKMIAWAYRRSVDG